MTKFIVVTTRIPTNYNQPESYVVEAEDEKDAKVLVKHLLRDFGDYSNFTYQVKPFVEPPAGKVLGRV